jgi:alpha-ribazole phosphatase
MTRAVRWWWVRHAPTGARGAVGWTDLPCDLTDAARLDRLAARLPHAPVLTSDLSRARDTAARVAPGTPEPRREPDLRELHFGDWEGLPFDEVARRFPEDEARFWAEPGPARATGGEGFDDLAARVSAAIDRTHARLGEGDVIAVAHMGVVLSALARALSLTPRQALGFQIDPLSLTRIDWLPETGAWRVCGVNETG